MTKWITILVFTLFLTINAFSQKKHLIFYPSGIDSVSADQAMELKSICNDTFGFSKVEVFGFADTLGSTQKNLFISQQRVNNIRKALIKYGVDSTIIICHAKGEEMNTTLTGSLSRRVQIDFTLPQINKLPDLYRLLQTEPEIFTINPKRDTVLLSKQNTILTIREGSLYVKSDEDVKIYLTEYYTKSDMILNRMSTMAGNERLISGGMLHILAVQKNDTLNLSRPITIEVPTKSKDPKMQLYYGKKNNDAINWFLAELNRVSSSSAADAHRLKKYYLFGRRKRIREQKRLKEEREKREIAISNQRQLIEKKVNGAVSFDDLKFYTYSISKFGFINVDQLPYTPGPKKKLTFGSDLRNIYVKLVFKDVKSILNCAFDEKTGYYVNNVPLKTKAFIVALSYENNTPGLCIMETTIDAQTSHYDLKFENITIEQLKEKLLILNN